MGAGNKITIIAEAKKGCPDIETLKKVVSETLRMEGIKNDIGVNLLLTDDKKIKELNRQFLGRNEPTDVLAFGAKKRSPYNKNLKGFIGEIAVSAETAEYNAERFNTTTEKEIFLYIIHGMLHLLGYEDRTKKEKGLIQKRQNKILEVVWQKII